jgi:hypothetical protein
MGACGGTAGGGPVGASAAHAPDWKPDLQLGHSPHQLKSNWILAVDARSAAFFGPDLGLAEQVRRRRGQLGEVVVDPPRPVRRVDRVRHKLAQVIDPGTST